MPHDAELLKNTVLCWLLLIAVLPGGDSVIAGTPLRAAPDSSIGVFRNATCFALDAEGNFYVIDQGTSELLKLSPEGKLLVKVGGYGWSNPGFDHPSDIIAPNVLDVYVSDYGNHRIEKFDRTLNLVSTLPSETEESPERDFGYPGGVGVSR